MSIPAAPTAPTFSEYIGSSEGESKAPIYVGGRKQSDLPCWKLSSSGCNTNTNCLYRTEYEVCEPRYTIAENKDQKNSYDEYIIQMRRQWVNRLTDLLNDAGCNMIDYVTRLKVFTGKETASHSIIFFGAISPTKQDKIFEKFKNNLVIKLSFETLYPLINFLEVETAIYKNIVTFLQNNRHTPNLVNFLGTIPCAISDLKIPKDEQKAFEDSMEEIDSGLYDKTRANLLFCEMSHGQTWRKWMNGYRTEKEILAVIFQILYTLLCFANIGLQHNDLHGGNILIEDMKRPITLYFKRGDTSYVELVTRYVPKIYDFDRGSIFHLAVPLNLGLDRYYCQSYGTCTWYNQKFDTFQFVAEMYQYLLPKVHLNIKNNLKAKWILKILDWTWYDNILETRERSHHLEYKEFPTDTQFKAPKDCLKEFLEAKWDDPPFTVKNTGIESIPSSLLFSPPEVKSFSVVPWVPVSTETHPALDLTTLTEEYEEEDNDLMDVWHEYCRHLGYNYEEREIILMTAIVMRKPMNALKKQWYLAACEYLVLPMFHQISRRDRFAVSQSSDIMKSVIDDIWNMFGNTLPITAAKLLMV